MSLFRRIFSYRPLLLAEQQASLVLAEEFQRTQQLHKCFTGDAIMMVQNRNDSLLFAYYLYGNVCRTGLLEYRPLFRAPFIYNALGQELDYHKSDFKTFPLYAGKHTIDVSLPNNVKISDLIILEELR